MTLTIKTILFDTYNQTIKSKHFEEKIKSIRYAYHKGLESLGDKLKKELPAFTPSATFTKGRKIEFLNQYSGIAHLDFDDISATEMTGKEVFKHAVEKMSKSVISVLEKSCLTVKDIDLLVPHQANARILNAVANRLELDESKVIITVENQANTSAASIPLALDLANSQQKIKKGDLVVLEALGGGLTWGSIALRW